MENQNQTPQFTDEKSVMALIDTMAQAATTFAGQGYEQFLYAREEVKTVLHNLYERCNTTRE